MFMSKTRVLTVCLAFIISVSAFITVTYAEIITVVDTYDPADIYFGTGSEPFYWEQDLRPYGYDPDEDQFLGAEISISFRDDEGDGLHEGYYCYEYEEGGIFGGSHTETACDWFTDGPWLEYASVFLDIGYDKSVYHPGGLAYAASRELEIDTQTLTWGISPTHPHIDITENHDGVFENLLRSVMPSWERQTEDAWGRSDAGGAWMPESVSWGAGSNNDFYFSSSTITFQYFETTTTNPDLPSDVESVPEPATVALLGIGLVGLAGAEVRRRRKKKAINS